MQYTFKCPACEHVVSVDAMSDEEAVGRIMAAGDEHMKQVHAGMPPTPAEQMKEMVKASMQKPVV